MTESDQRLIDPEQWVNEYGDYLFKYAYARMGNRASAEDVVQETFLGALKSVDKFDGNSDAKFWLLGILKHKIVDYIRKESREAPLEDPDALELISSASFKYTGIPPHRPASWRINPRKAFEQKEFWDIYLHCVSKLTGLPQKAYALRELEEMETEDVCKSMNIDANYLWVLIHRARNQLKGCLEENWIKKTKGGKQNVDL